MNKKQLFSLLFIGAMVLGLPKGASADLGPKPTVDIEVTYNHQKISDATFNAKMLSCVPKDFAQSESVNQEDLIPELKINDYDSVKNCYWFPARFAWGGQCSNSQCSFGYFPPNDFKLAVFVPSLGKVFITNEIFSTNFNSYYQAQLFSDGNAKISEITPAVTLDKVSLFVKGFVITVILELLVSLIFISVYKLSRKILIYVLFANIISLPVVWFLFPLIKLPILVVIIMYEFFAVLFETYFVYFLGKQKISLRQSAILNVINNAISLFLGGAIYLVLKVF